MASDIRPGVEPTVVFIAQLGTCGASWQPVIGRLTCKSGTFTYDRPGTGSAPPRPAPNPPLPYSAFADELADLLDQHDIIEPTVIVGHSVGGLIGRSFASRHPHRVAGFVAIDASIPGYNLRPDLEPIIDGDNADSTEIDIIAGHVEILTEHLPDVPAAVIVRRAHFWWPSFADIPNPAMDDLWQVSQRLLAEKLSAPLVRTTTGHQIPGEAPDLVAYVVDRVVQAVRDGGAVVLDERRLTELGARLSP